MERQPIYRSHLNAPPYLKDWKLCEEFGLQFTEFITILPDTGELRQELSGYITAIKNDMKSDLEEKIVIMHSDFERKIGALISDSQKEIKTVRLDIEQHSNKLKSDFEKGIKYATCDIPDINKAVASIHNKQLNFVTKKELGQLRRKFNQYTNDEVLKSQRKIGTVIAMLIVSGLIIMMHYTNAYDLSSPARDKVNADYGVCHSMFDERHGIANGGKISVLDSKMDQIKLHFHGEHDRFWSSLFAPIRRIIQEEYPSRPAVVLIAIRRSSRSVAECLVSEVANLVESFFGIKHEDGSYVTLDAEALQLNPNKAKSEMDKALSDNYQRPHKVAVIHDLGSLPPDAAALLHAYCDNESAHFRKAVLLATVYMEPGTVMDIEEVEAYLLNCWEELEKDLLKPLLSRVANNIALMESNDIIYDFCETWYFHKNFTW